MEKEGLMDALFKNKICTTAVAILLIVLMCSLVIRLRPAQIQTRFGQSMTWKFDESKGFCVITSFKAKRNQARIMVELDLGLHYDWEVIRVDGYHGKNEKLTEMTFGPFLYEPEGNKQKIGLADLRPGQVYVLIIYFHEKHKNPTKVENTAGIIVKMEDY